MDEQTIFRIILLIITIIALIIMIVGCRGLYLYAKDLHFDVERLKRRINFLESTFATIGQCHVTEEQPDASDTDI